MPDDHHPSTPDGGQDEDERDVRAMADTLREGLKDPATRKHMRRLTEAAMGDEPAVEPPAADGPGEG